MVLILGLGAFFGYGRPRSDYVVQLASAGAVGLVALALVVVALGALWVSRAYRAGTSRTSGRIHFEAGRGFARGAAVPRIWLPFVELELGARNPSGLRVTVEGGRERFEAPHRLAAGHIDATSVVEDGFGLARIELRRVDQREVQVGPWAGELDRALALRALAPGETMGHPRGRPAGDLIEMKPYVRGDPLRLVLWKVYARTGELVVRAEERALDDDTQVHAYLVAGPGDEASAAAAAVALRQGLFGPRWRFGADGSEPSATIDPALHAVAASFGAPSAADLPAFLRGVSADARVVLFLPCRPGPWLASTIGPLRPFAGRCTAVVGCDGTSDLEAKSWLRQPAPTREELPRSGEIDEVVRALAAAGIDVHVLDRRTGKPLRDSRRRAA